MSWESGLLSFLSASLARPLALAAAAGLVLRIGRVRHPASRHAVWSVVLIGLVLLPVVSVVAPHWKLPVLPAKDEVSAPLLPAAVAAQPQEQDAEPSLPVRPAIVAPLSGFRMPSVETLVVWCYLAGLLAMALYRVAGWAMLRRVLARSMPVRGTMLRESRDVIAPVAVGVLRPVVILPVGWRGWNSETRRAVLAHEFAHIRRKDTLISALGRMVRSVLWFHPLAWWVSRKVSELAELACDAVALESSGNPGGYSRILVEFASGVNRAGYRVALPGLAMAAHSDIGERIDQVFEVSGGKMRKLARPGVLLAVVGLPVMGLAATVGMGTKVRPVPVVAQVVAQATPQPQPKQRPAATAPPVTAVKADVPEFDVAEVRVNKLSDAPEMVVITNPARGGSPTEVMIYSDGRTAREPALTPNGTVTLRYVTMRQMIMQAYIKEISRDEYLTGGPGWLDSDHFDLIAKAAPDTSVDTERLMVQRVLAERFHLMLHREQKPMPAYALVAGKGLKLQPAAGSGDPNCKATHSGFPSNDERRAASEDPPRSGFACTNMTLAEFAGRLTNKPLLVTEFSDRPVTDLTGIKGAYDFQADWAVPMPEGGSPRATPEGESAQRQRAVDALDHQLGLKVEERKEPVPVIVIDRVDRVPTEN